MLCGASLQAFAAAPAPASVSDCWIRALPGDLPKGGYFKAHNAGDPPVNLVGISSNAFGMAMLHQTESQGSTSSMAMIEQVAVPAHGTALEFAPGNYHAMLGRAQAGAQGRLVDSADLLVQQGPESHRFLRREECGYDGSVTRWTGRAARLKSLYG